jgi:hypothetical protein
VPFAGVVTHFSVNSASDSSGTPVVALRVLRPAGGGQFTGEGTSPREPLTMGLNTYTVTLPVKAGDVLALDNDTSALIFDTSDPTPITAYYQPLNADGTPGLQDGQTAAPNNTRNGYRLLLSADVISVTAPPNFTKITKSKIKRKKHKAKFSFTASGTVTGFQCKLIKPHKKHQKSHASFSSCSSPKTYKHLAPGRYTFKVRATNSDGPDPHPASKSFSIP